MKDEEIVELARELPVESIDVDKVRAALLAAPVTRAPRRVWPWAAAAATLAAAAVLAFVVLGGGGAKPVYRGTITVHDGTAMTRISAAPDEIVRLTEGTVTVRVAPLAAGERFRVVVGDAEVEVRGTLFDVVARGDRLAEVVVMEGLVEVRPQARPTVLLRAGDRWTAQIVAVVPSVASEGPLDVNVQAPVVAPVAPDPVAPPRRLATRRVTEVPAPPAPEPEPPPVVVPEVAPEPAPPPRRPAPSATALTAFDSAWQLLRANKPAEAAELFATAAAEAGDDPLAEDASFWHAVALQRAQRRAAAASAMRAFLHRFPSSPRAGEASAILGWQLLEDGDLDAARRLFEAAAEDSSADVAASARRGLDEVARRAR